MICMFQPLSAQDTHPVLMQKWNAFKTKDVGAEEDSAPQPTEQLPLSSAAAVEAAATSHKLPH